MNFVKLRLRMWHTQAHAAPFNARVSAAQPRVQLLQLGTHARQELSSATRLRYGAARGCAQRCAAALTRNAVRTAAAAAATPAPASQAWRRLCLFSCEDAETRSDERAAEQSPQAPPARPAAQRSGSAREKVPGSTRRCRAGGWAAGGCAPADASREARRVHAPPELGLTVLQVDGDVSQQQLRLRQVVGPVLLLLGGRTPARKPRA